MTWVIVGVGEEKDGLYYLLQQPKPSHSKLLSSSQISQPIHLRHFSVLLKNVSTEKWHYRLGHLSDSILPMLQSSIPSLLCNSNPCSICPLAIQKCVSFLVSLFKSNKIFDLIHCDIWGPFSANSINGCHYFVTIVDDFSRYTSIHLMQSKAQTCAYI